MILIVFGFLTLIGRSTASPLVERPAGRRRPPASPPPYTAPPSSSYRQSPYAQPAAGSAPDAAPAKGGFGTSAPPRQSDPSGAAFGRRDMRRRSLTGPLLLLLVGGVFLWRNLHPETPIFDLLSLYWPFVLIAWGLLRLGEVIVWSRQGYRSSFTGGEVVLVVLICVAGSGIWQAHRSGLRFAANGLDLWGQPYDFPVSASASSEGAKRIVFENPRGNIKVTGGDAQDVQVTGRKLIRSYSRADAERTNGATPVEIVLDGDALRIRTNQDRAPENQRISDDLEVAVPRRLAVEARAGTADYEIADITGDVELGSDHGDVRLARLGGNASLEIGHSDLIRATGVQGNLELRGDGSDIEFENISGQTTISGSYRGTLDFKNLAKPLQFEGARNTEVHVQAAPAGSAWT